MTTSSVSPVTTELAGSETGITLVIHAGAGSRGKHSTPERIAQVELDLQRALDAGYQLLESGAPAHEAVVAAIHVMEDAPEFNAGRGAALTSDGIAQMDACLMTGDGEVGAVTGVSTVKNPIDAARAVKEQTKHVLFADPTDAEIADWGVATESNEYFITEQRRQSLAEAQSGGDEWEKHGTIGAVARDAEGNIAAGTSTGGITNQMHGRWVIRRCLVAARSPTSPRWRCPAPASARRSSRWSPPIRCRIVCVSPARTSRMPRRPLWTKSPRIMAMAA